MAYRRASLIDFYLHTNFHSNRRNFCGRTDGRTEGRTESEAGFTRLTRMSRANKRSSIVMCGLCGRLTDRLQWPVRHHVTTVDTHNTQLPPQTAVTFYNWKRDDGQMKPQRHSDTCEMISCLNAYNYTGAFNRDQMNTV